MRRDPFLALDAPRRAAGMTPVNARKVKDSP